MTIAAVALLALSAVSITACGGDDDDAKVPTAAATATSVPTAEPSPTGAAEAQPVLPASAVDKDGAIIEIKDLSRIVVLNGDLAEVVYALGLGENVVGLDTSATYPPEAKEKQNIGYQRSLSAEGILSLQPTLIIGSETAGPPAVIEQLRGAGATLVLFKSVSTLEGITEKINNVATALGVPMRGKELAKKTQAELDEAMALAKKATSQPNVAFLYLRGASTQFIMGAGSGADVMISAANAKDAGVAAGVNGSAPITAEALVTAQPDVILVLTAGLASVNGVDGVLQIPGVAQTPAGQSKRIIDLDDQYLLGLGPRAGQALMDLVRALHPELKG
ncbi:MAG: hemin ABC transporter substrate-binding protein [Dehalococcoidia bacterium]